jgi:prepilin-type N-terminal cleavage/methylation domain-containing protein/prepilin-type processing-associated H-X9-DG protein
MKRKGFTLIELLVVIAIIAILAAILFPVFAQAREKARQITCASNLKQVGLAILQYQQDYDEVYPMGQNANWYGSGWPDTVTPYIKSFNVFRCPDDSATTLNANQWETATPYGDGISYASNGYMAWDWKTANAWVMMGVMGVGPNGNPLYVQKTPKALAGVTEPAATIMVAEKHSDDVQAYGGDGVGTTGSIGMVFTEASNGYGWESSAPGNIPNGSATGTAFDTGVNGAVSTVHAGKTLANFLFADGHVKAMQPVKTNPDPGNNLDSNDGQSLDNMWDADRQ